MRGGAVVGIVFGRLDPDKAAALGREGERVVVELQMIGNYGGRSAVLLHRQFSFHCGEVSAKRGENMGWQLVMPSNAVMIGEVSQ